VGIGFIYSFCLANSVNLGDEECRGEGMFLLSPVQHCNQVLKTELANSFELGNVQSTRYRQLIKPQKNLLNSGILGSLLKMRILLYWRIHR